MERGGFDILKIRLGRTNIDEDLYAIESVKKHLAKKIFYFVILIKVIICQMQFIF